MEGRLARGRTRPRRAETPKPSRAGEARRRSGARQAAARPQIAHRRNYLAGLSAFFKEMQKTLRYPRMQILPTFQQNFVKKKERASEPGWTPFNEGDLKRIFDPENYARLVKPHEFWFPLIALFTGARREEIAQLTLDDIREEQSTWIIDINDRDFKSVKTRAGVRVIPLHPALVAVGFLNYLDDVRAVAPKAKRIFPYLRFDASNGFGDVPGEAFARYLDSLGIRDADKVLHSFRKNANNRLMDNGVEEVLRCRMVGHSYDSVNVTKYTTGVTIKMLNLLGHSEADLSGDRRPRA